MSNIRTWSTSPIIPSLDGECFAADPIVQRAPCSYKSSIQHAFACPVVTTCTPPEYGLTPDCCCVCCHQRRVAGLYCRGSGRGYVIGNGTLEANYACPLDEGNIFSAADDADI